MVQSRQTAYKVWIADLISGEYHKEAGEWAPNFVLVKDKKVSRVNVIASVVDKYVSDGEGYVSLDLDDGSGVIKVKVWKDDVSLLNNVNIGELINLVGRAREFNNEIYLTPEIVKKIDNISWAKLRKLELLKLYGEPRKQEVPIPVVARERVVSQLDGGEIPEENLTQSKRQRILDIISKGDEVSYDVLVKDSGYSEEEVMGVIKDLIKEGEVYQPKPGVIRAI